MKETSQSDHEAKIALIEALQRGEWRAAGALLEAYELRRPADPDLPVLRDALETATAQREPSEAARQERRQAGPAGGFNILFVQNAPCIRNYKSAVTLRERGHRVTLAYTDAKLSQMYKGLSDDVYSSCIKINDFRELWDLAESFDVVHCHNEPDVLSVAAMAGRTPVIHDTHDLISLRHPDAANLRYFEGVANRGAAGRVYTTPFQLEKADELYRIDRSSSAVTYNFALRRDLPSEIKPKLSAGDGQVHFVYEGGVGLQAHRDFRALFVRLTEHGHHVHIYPARHSPEYEQLAGATPRLHYHGSISPTEIIGEMTQYDFGLVPFHVTIENRAFLETTIANKLFEYVAAGLPVAVSDVRSLRSFVEREGLGIVFRDGDQIAEQLGALRQIDVEDKRRRYLFEEQGEILEALYKKVIDDNKKQTESADREGANRKDTHGNRAPAVAVSGDGAPASVAAPPKLRLEKVEGADAWNELVARSPHARYAHSAEYHTFALNDRVVRLTIHVEDETYLFPFETHGDVAASFGRYYGGVIPLTTYRHFDMALTAAEHIVGEVGLQKLLLSYLDAPGDPFLETVQETISKRGGAVGHDPHWKDAWILRVDRPYDEIRRSAYSQDVGDIIREAAGKGVECRIVDILEHVSDAVACSDSAPRRDPGSLPDYYYDEEAYRRTMIRWQSIFGDAMISFGAFVDDRLVAYINSFALNGEAIINSSLWHSDYEQMGAAQALFDFMNRYHAERNDVQHIMWSFDNAPSIAPLKRSLGYEPRRVHRFLSQPDAAAETPRQAVASGEKGAHFYDALYTSGGWDGEYHKPYEECNYYPSWERVLSWLRSANAPAVVDVGCGPGQFAQMLFDHGITSYRGIDFSPKAVELARRSNPDYQACFRVDDAYTSDVFDEGFDHVVLLEVLEHLDEDLVLLERIPAGATVIFSVPNFDSESHVRFFQSMEAVLERYAQVIDVTDTDEVVFPNYASKLFLVKGVKKAGDASVERDRVHDVAA